MENCFLKRVLDFRLVYDCLADTKSGVVRLDSLVHVWPALNTLPRDCEKFWRQSATPDGFLDWNGFSGGLEKALRADEERLSKGGFSQPKQGHMMRASPVAQVTSGEIERFLSSCDAESLVRALAKTGRDVYRWQVSIHKRSSSSSHGEDGQNVAEPAANVSSNVKSNGEKVNLQVIWPHNNS